MGVEAVGVELGVPHTFLSDLLVIQADAVRDPLPACDVALAVCVVHHLTDGSVVELSPQCRPVVYALVILDLVRHPLPLVLFRCVTGIGWNLSTFRWLLHPADCRYFVSLRRCFPLKRKRSAGLESPADPERFIAHFLSGAAT